MQKLARQVFGNNNTDTCARVCHSPTGYGLSTTFGTSAGTQDFDSVEQADVIAGDRRQSDRRASGVRLAHEEAAAPGCQADRHRSAPHRPGAHAACRGDASPAAAARHQRRGADVAGACDRHRRPGGRRLRARTLRLGCVPGLGAFRRRGTQQSGGSGEDQRRAGADDPRGGAAVRDGAQRRDLLRAGRDRAQPGHHRGDGAGKSRDGDRQYRPAGRRREPAARAEQRAGKLRHGLVPARTAGLPPHLQPRRARDLRTRMGRDAGSGAGSADSQHDRRRARWLVQGHLHPGRGHRAVRSRHAATSPQVLRRWNASWCTTCS